MFVNKRNGEKQRFTFDKISKRLDRLSRSGIWGPALDINVDKITLETIRQLCDGIDTSKIDEISAAVSYEYMLDNPQYSVLASRILVSNLHKQASPSFSKFATAHESLFAPDIYQWICENSVTLNKIVDLSLDYYYDYFGIRKFIDTYAWNATYNGKSTYSDIPQYMHLRVAIMVNFNVPELKRLTAITETYLQCANWYYTHATPTLINSCRKEAQLNSCFLLGVDDNTSSIVRDCFANCCEISKRGGGIGIHYSGIRARGSIIKSTNGEASGIARQLTVFDSIPHAWNQSGKRNASIAIYMEPWHADIIEVLQLKISSGDAGLRAKNLYYGIWMCDLFMRRALDGREWSLFSPDTAPYLNEVYDGMEICSKCGFCGRSRGLTNITRLGLYDFTLCEAVCDAHTVVVRDVFTDLYTRYENSGLARKVVPATQILELILRSQREVGMPYVLFKDTANRCSNQKNIGTIRSSNLCTEIIEYSDAKNYAVCTLASIVLPKFVVGHKVGCANWSGKVAKIGKVTGRNEIITLCRQVYNFVALGNTVSHIVKRLNNSIIVGTAPVNEILGILHLAPIGIGIQGLADVFAILGVGFDSEFASVLDQMVIECIYYSAVIASSKLARKNGPYPGYMGSPASRGQLRPDLALCGDRDIIMTDLDSRARESVRANGLANSLLIALMPTNSTSRLFGNQDMFEPFTSMIYNRQTGKGSITVINTHLLRDLIDYGVWNRNVKRQLLENNGNILSVDGLPEYFYQTYKNVREIKISTIVKRAQTRQRFVCQSQSLNHYPINNNDVWLQTIMFKTWEHGLITGSYYIHTTSATEAQKIKTKHVETEKKEVAATGGGVCYIGCESCSA